MPDQEKYKIKSEYIPQRRSILLTNHILRRLMNEEDIMLSRLIRSGYEATGMQAIAVNYWIYYLHNKGMIKSRKLGKYVYLNKNVPDEEALAFIAFTEKYIL